MSVNGPIAGLSGVVITLNEEEHIAECLAGLTAICGEVLVLDSGSTDRTREICESYRNVRFETHAFDGFQQQKNRAMAMAQGPWILCLDADERITAELQGSVRSFLGASPAPHILGAKFIRLTYHMGDFIRYSGWRHYRYRLVRKGLTEWRGVQGYDLHELLYPIDPPQWSRRLGVALPGEIIHYSRTDLSDQVNTMNTYSSIYAFNRYRRGKRRFLLRMLYKPLTRFLEMYFVKGGILDGMRGFIIAVTSSYAVFLRWAKLYELSRLELVEPSNLPRYLQRANQQNKT